VRGGLMGSARLIMAIEEHGGGKQLVKFAVKSNFSTWGVVISSLFAALGAIAFAGGNWWIAGLLFGIAVAIVARKQYESMMSMTAIREALKSLYLEFGNAHSQAD
jgi:O-antigen biosynthesis protein